jgi:hypothetical protein
MTPWSSTLARRSLECAPMLLQPVLNNLTLITLTSFVGTLGPAALAGSGLAGVAAGGFLVLRHDAGGSRSALALGRDASRRSPRNVDHDIWRYGGGAVC